MSLLISETSESNQNSNPKLSNLEPRPPVPGRETEDPDVSERSPRAPGPPGPALNMGHENSMKPAPSPWEGLPQPVKTSKRSDLLKTMAPSPQAGSEAGSARGFEPEGSADVTPPFSESNSANSSPAYLKWAENLHNLLADPDGVELYKSYMKTENVGEILDFWFACEGLKRLPSEQTEKIYQIIKVINKKFLRSKLVPIGEETRKVISDKIATKSGTDQTIFDNAQCEVEEKMTRTTYRNFLASELYLNYIQNMQVGEHSDLSPKLSGSHSTESSISGRGVPVVGHAGVGDDSGHFSAPIPDIEKSKSNQSLASTGRAMSSALSNLTSDSTSGVSEASGSGPGTNTSVVTPAAPNSTIITVNQSQTDNSMLGSDEPNVMQYNMSHSTTLPTLHENSELELGPDVASQCPSLPQSLMSSLTHANISLTARKRHQIKPESQAGVYLHQGGGGRVPHPYHAYNSAYNPVSRQDSELHSELSSEAHTTDDNMSSFTESSSHYSNQYRLQHNKKYLRRQARRIQEQSRQNREQQFHPQANNFIPRTERIPAEASHQLSPVEFADILIKKLEKVKREQELDEKLNRKLAEDAQSMVSQGSNRSLAEMLREKLIVTDDFEGDQSILDDHVSRIWTDKTPLRSPGEPSGRPRSPGYSRSSRPPLASLPPRLSSSVTMGAMGPPPPRRAVQTAGRRTGGAAGGGGAGGMYHQDLAYYDLGPAGQGAPPGAGVNERVREWMLDVERQQSVEVGHDQRSHSSKGNVKTSPRSNRLKTSGHRPVTQERMMSTSWSGSGQMYPQQAKLGASLVMPPPSQANTLRKPAVGQDVTVAVYTFSHEKGEPMPYRIKIPAKNVTLRQVKEFLPKKGAFRFYFKTEVDGDMCYEEETEDSSLVPLWEGKILVQCRLLD